MQQLLLLRLVSVIVTLLLVWTNRADGFGCLKQLSTCSCLTDVDDWILDLQALGRDSGFFVSSPHRSDVVYLYNPCTPVYCDLDADAAVCRVTREGTTVYRGMGAHRTMSFETSDSAGQIRLVYPLYSNGSKHNGATIVELVCDPSEPVGALSFDPTNEERRDIYNFKLATTYACQPKDAQGLLVAAKFNFIMLMIIFIVVGIVVVACAVANWGNPCCTFEGRQETFNTTPIYYSSAGGSGGGAGLLDASAHQMPVVSSVDGLVNGFSRPLHSLGHGVSTDATATNGFSSPLFPFDQPIVSPTAHTAPTAAAGAPQEIQASLPSYDRVQQMEMSEVVSVALAARGSAAAPRLTFVNPLAEVLAHAPTDYGNAADSPPGAPAANNSRIDEPRRY